MATTAEQDIADALQGSFSTGPENHTSVSTVSAGAIGVGTFSSPSNSPAAEPTQIPENNPASNNMSTTQDASIPAQPSVPAPATRHEEAIEMSALPSFPPPPRATPNASGGPSPGPSPQSTFTGLVTPLMGFLVRYLRAFIVWSFGHGFGRSIEDIFITILSFFDNINPIAWG
ncbi:hypothetical protein NLI96_g8305 [Meripilus lineatus]|uniref:Uncharacterized protein n=1 Tax=Meripilus lineatus TaxID=2056292 RepID=A0AAD5UXI1_9APHY|nr:hypothetical protein NLI96_g8305 [Physisporinus lineatus]